MDDTFANVALVTKGREWFGEKDFMKYISMIRKSSPGMPNAKDLHVTCLRMLESTYFDYKKWFKSFFVIATYTAV